MFDANTVVSAALNPDGPRRPIATARTRGTIALSEAVHREVAEVLARPNFARALTDDRRREILELLSAAALWIAPGETVRDCRDGKDNRYLEVALALALAAGATAIVSEPVNLSNLRDDDTQCGGSVCRLAPIPCGRLVPSPID